VIKLFQNENGRTLTHNEPVSFLKENLQDLLGRVSSTPVQDPTYEKEELVSCWRMKGWDSEFRLTFIVDLGNNSLKYLNGGDAILF
jgi:hypothetical protein